MHTSVTIAQATEHDKSIRFVQKSACHGVTRMRRMRLARAYSPDGSTGKHACFTRPPAGRSFLALRTGACHPRALVCILGREGNRKVIEEIRDFIVSLLLAGFWRAAAPLQRCEGQA
jgi:hypothetical protein